MFFRTADRLSAGLLSACGQRLYQAQTRAVLDSIAGLEATVAKIPAGDIELLVRALVAGEDRRFFEHRGVDTKAVLRAIVTFARSRRLQGASTITQQLVRVLTRDYRLSLARKIKEMCVACIVDAYVPKRAQALSYLIVGYYGWRMNGLLQALQRLRSTSPLTTESASGIVARLRFPEPQHATGVQSARIQKRTAYIRNLIQ